MKPSEVTYNSQKDYVLDHLMHFHSITALEAIEYYGILDLASVISHFRKAGLPIESIKRTGKNRFGKSVNYVEYQLKEVKSDDSDG